MAECEQAPGLTMLQHGELVHAHYKALCTELQNNEADPALQKWWELAKHALPSPEVLKPYHVYHDCGKHLTLTVDSDGKRRYPDHASASAEQYSALFPQDTFTTHLIRHDMDFHTMRGPDLCSLWNDPCAPILYLTAWAEIRANASMFGGVDSESYKIKRSRLIQAAKKFSQSTQP